MKRIYVILLLLGTFSCFLYGYINVDPLYFDKRIDGVGGYKEYTLTNSTNKTLRYRVYSEKISNQNDMSSWIDFYPKSITLKKGESKKIKVLITAPVGTKEGEYIANLGIKEIPIPLLESTSAVSLYTNLQIELAGYVGNIKPQLSISKLQIIKNNNYLKLFGKIENIGKIRTKAEFYLENENKDKIYLGSYRLFKGDRKDLNKLEPIKINIKNIEKYKTFLVTDRDGKIILKKKIKIMEGK